MLLSGPEAQGWRRLDVELGNDDLRTPSVAFTGRAEEPVLVTSLGRIHGLRADRQGWVAYDIVIDSERTLMEVVTTRGDVAWFGGTRSEIMWREGAGPFERFTPRFPPRAALCAEGLEPSARAANRA